MQLPCFCRRVFPERYGDGCDRSNSIKVGSLREKVTVYELLFFSDRLTYCDPSCSINVEALHLNVSSICELPLPRNFNRLS